jgi:mannose-6-phosphate isomerase-like protein (cupin superfamily)
VKQNADIIKKGWGSEIIFANNDKYCGKLLTFNKGSKFSMHFHLLKDETWYLNSGKILLKWIDTRDASKHEMLLEPGDVWRNKPCEPHQVEAIEDSVIFEVSTTHYDYDSYRIEPGDSQKNKGLF